MGRNWIEVLLVQDGGEDDQQCKVDEEKGTEGRLTGRGRKGGGGGEGSLDIKGEKVE